jgi:tRNA modification GTPase
VHSLDDTIAAIASPPGGAARGIVRTSGPGLRRCLEQCFRPSPPLSLASLTVPTAVPGVIWLAGVAAPLPADLYLWPGRRSYTGQSVAELHTLGSPPLLEAVLHAICAGGARLAEPGEFTLRAFLAGRIDLTQAEAVLGVIDAGSAQQLHAALAQLAGGLATPLRRLRGTLLDLLAHLEAGFDFADEDLQFITPEQLIEQLAAAARTVAQLLAQTESRAAAGATIRIVLTGRPNAGKSSLFNALARGSAIVSPQPGTTRDYLTAEIDLGGVKCELVDTAGVESLCGESAAADIHAAAQAATAARQREADLEVLCLDASRPPELWETAAPLAAARHIAVFTKSDLPRGVGWPAKLHAIRVSAATGAGLESLAARLGEAVLAVQGGAGEVVAGTAVRCRESLRRAGEALAAAETLAVAGGGDELVAAELRSSLDDLGHVVGAVYTEDLLDRIFSRFCVGK